MCHSLNQLTSFFILYYLSIVKSVTYYIDPDATSSGSGSSWFDSFQHLEDALNIASPGDFIYLRGDRIYIPNTSNREQCFNIPPDISIYGGFAGTETSHNQRPSDPSLFEQYESVISGNIGNKDTNLDNCYHVLTYNQQIKLNRVVISWGNANFEYNGPEMRNKLNGFGAALITNDILSVQNVIITDSILKNNEALSGGALFFGSSSNFSSSIGNPVNVVITNSVFKDNNALNGLFEGGYGGAIYAYNNVKISIFQTIFQNNYAEFKGGALYQDFGGKILCNQCEFNDNKVNGFGGGIFTENRYSMDGTRLQIGQDTIFNRQTASIYGGATVILHGVTSIIKDTTFSNNIAGVDDNNGGWGGATAIFWSNVTGNNVNYNQNQAKNNPDNNDNYNENELIFQTVDPGLNIDLNLKMLEIWGLYQEHTNDIDIFPDRLNTICYVNNDNSAGIQNGNSWNSAHNNIQNCLDELQNNGGEIWVVGNGENKPYKPTKIHPMKQGATGDMHKSFILYNNVRVYGGFSGTETLRSQRNFHEYPTYLSGEISNNQRVNNIIVAAGINGALIDGFFIVNAGCSSNFNEVVVGGGIFSVQSEFHVANSIFYKLCSNRVGGAIFCVGRQEPIIHPNIRNTMFLGNTASFDGGALYATSQCNIQCKWCSFQVNSASRRGGAVYLHGNSDGDFDMTNFFNNYALDSGGCVAVEEISNATFHCNQFVNNSARWEGGCLYAGTGSEIQRHIEPLFQGFIVYGSSFNNVFQNNYLLNGGYFNKGQRDIYLWPYTDFVFLTEPTCDESTTLPPAPTTLPPVPTTLPPVPTTLPPVPTTLPPVPTTLPPVPTTLPPVPTTLPPVPTTLPPVPTTLPPVPTTLPPVPTPHPTPPVITRHPTTPHPIPTPNPTQRITPYPSQRVTPYPTHRITPYPTPPPITHYPTYRQTPYPTPPPITPYPTPRPITPYPTPPPITPYPTPPPITPYPTPPPITQNPTTSTTQPPPGCCECLQTDYYTPGCPHAPECAKLVCDVYNLGRCCTGYWGVQCVTAAMQNCKGYEPSHKTCCGCLYQDYYGGCPYDLQCERLICSEDPFCCFNIWDSYCVQKAYGYCKGYSEHQSSVLGYVSNVGSNCCGCTNRNSVAGCNDDAQCEKEICNSDPFCCERSWDESCARQAAVKCGLKE